MFSFLVLSAVLIKLYVIFSHSSPSFSPPAADDEAEWHGNREANGLKREWRRAFGYCSYFYGFWPGFAGNFRRLPFGPWLPHPALLLAEYFAAGVIFGIKHVRALITHSRHVLVGLLA